MLICYSILFLLCICVLILCLILFVPFRYASDGYKHSDAYLVRAKLTYLWPLLSVRVLLPPEQDTVNIKIGGIKWKPKTPKEDSQDGTEADSKEPTNKQPRFKKKKRKKGFIKDIEYYVELWQNNKELILDVLRTVGTALATVLPKDIEARVVFGTGMADVTGFIYAVYCVLESYLPEGVSVTPLWIEKHLEGEYKLRGKIRLFPLIVALIRIVSNQNVRILYKKLRRE